MKKITSSFTILLSFLYVSINFAQISPQQGVTPPAYFWEFQQMLQTEYSKGYYADKFRERKQIREKIAQGLLPESILLIDTVFALTLMGQYPDLSGSYSQQEFQSQLYDGPNPTGTITDYYTEVSYNQLYFTGDAKGWYDVPGNLQSYIGGNGGPQFVVDVIVNADPTLNFADYIQYYDGQGRPHISFLAVVHSGAGAEAGANNIWSHRWDFTVLPGQGPYITNDVDPISGQSVIIDGPYAIMPERNGNNNNSGTLIEIGVFAHEFGHIFGIPDLYDTDGSSEGVGNWCLMGGGAWGGSGTTPETPVHMCAWVKKELGWVTPINITSFQNVLSVPNVEENPIVYRMWRGSLITPEYFLIENRQKIGFDVNIYESGFLIFHVDETRNGNQNENRYLVDLEQADGLRNLNNGEGRGDAGDPFPGSTQNTRFDFNTNPNNNDYSLQNTFVSLRNIYKDGNMMVADFEVGPRSGASAYGDPVTSDFGGVEVGTTSIIKTVTLTNYGDQDLVISDIPSSVGDFNMVTSLTFPIILSPYDDSLSLAFTFSPTVVGSAQEYYTMSSNDTDFPGFNMSGHGVIVYPALDKTIYASSGEMNSGEILTIDASTGAGTLLGSSLFDRVKSLSIHPTSGKIYGLVARNTDADLIKVNSGGGDSYTLFTLNLPQMASIAFDTAGTLYGILRNGNLYTIDLAHGTYTLVVDAVGSYSGIVFHPMTNELWASASIIAGPNVDAIFKVDLTTGDTTIVGHTGLGKQTNDIVFDESSNLFGIIGANNELSDFISIDASSGLGTIIGSVGFQDMLGLAYAETGVTEVDDDKNKVIPEMYKLSQNYPNPFNPNTTIKYQISEISSVSIKVYDVLGNEIEILVNEEKAAGNYEVELDASTLSSGIYFYRLQAGSFVETKKMVLMK